MSGQRLAFNVQRTGSLRGRASSPGPGRILLVEEGLVGSLSPSSSDRGDKAAEAGMEAQRREHLGKGKGTGQSSFPTTWGEEVPQALGSAEAQRLCLLKTPGPECTQTLCHSAGRKMDRTCCFPSAV